jgi:hypothetical protein
VHRHRKKVDDVEGTERRGEDQVDGGQ